MGIMMKRYKAYEIKRWGWEEVGVVEKEIDTILLNAWNPPPCGLCGRLYVVRVKSSAERFYALAKLRHAHSDFNRFYEYIIVKRLEKPEIKREEALQYFRDYVRRLAGYD